MADLTRSIFALTLLAATFFLFSNHAIAETLNLSPARDNTLYQDNSGSLSNGAGSGFFAGVTGSGGPGILRSLLLFDIAAEIPAGSTITDATLTLHLSRSNASIADNFDLHRVLDDWGEAGSTPDRGVGGGGAGGTAQTGDATWIHQFFASETWDTPGGDFSETVSATQSVGGFNFLNDDENFYEWNSSQLTSDIQSMLDDPDNNFGWLLKIDQETNFAGENIPSTARRFDTRENASAQNRPVLAIEFDPPVELTADFDGDEDVDGDDLRIWESGFGTDSGNGDADEDGDSDGDDFLTWQQEFTGPGQLQTATVPEPTTCGLAVAALLLVLSTDRASGSSDRIR